LYKVLEPIHWNSLNHQLLVVPPSCLQVSESYPDGLTIRTEINFHVLLQLTLSHHLVKTIVTRRLPSTYAPDIPVFTPFIINFEIMSFLRGDRRRMIYLPPTENIFSSPVRSGLTKKRISTRSWKQILHFIARADYGNATTAINSYY